MVSEMAEGVWAYQSDTDIGGYFDKRFAELRAKDNGAKS